MRRKARFYNALIFKYKWDIFKNFMHPCHYLQAKLLF